MIFILLGLKNDQVYIYVYVISFPMVHLGLSEAASTRPIPVKFVAKLNKSKIESVLEISILINRFVSVYDKKYQVPSKQTINAMTAKTDQDIITV